MTRINRVDLIEIIIIELASQNQDVQLYSRAR